MKTHRFYMPTDVRCGPEALAALGEVGQYGTCPAILCGQGSARRYGYLERIVKALPGALVLEGFPENPTFTDCEAYVPACRHAGIDVVVALGGGSVIDGAKALAMLLPNEGTCADFLAQIPANRPLPLIAIPTTAGTGSEVTPYAVLVDPVKNRKATLRSPDLFPRMALLDPTLTLTMSRELTLATALDALSQAMEGMLSRKATPTGDVLALEVCRAVTTWLPIVLQAPDNLKARQELMHAAMLSGMVISGSGTTLVHGMGYHYTLEHGIAHGVANALLLPPLFWWNSHLAPLKVALLADAMGHTCLAWEKTMPAAMSDILYRFYHKIQFSHAARDHGVPEAALLAMAQAIIQEPYRFKNQQGTFTAGQVGALYRASWEGSIDGLTVPEFGSVTE